MPDNNFNPIATGARRGRQMPEGGTFTDVNAFIAEREDNAANTANTDRRAQARRILEDTVIFRLEVHKPSLIKKLTDEEKAMLVARAKRKKASGQQEESLDHLRMSKELIDLDAMRPIRALDAQHKAYLKYVEVKTTILGGGSHLIPLAFVREVVDETNRYITRRAELVAQFAQEFPELRAAQIEKDPELYKIEDYPSVDELVGKFSVEYSLKSEDVPKKLGRIDAQVLKREMEKAEAKWSNVGDEIAQGLRESLATLIESAAEQLGTDDGRPRVFRDSMVEKINRFVQTFEGRNALVNDQMLPQMIADLRAAMQGVTPDTLRKDMDVRARVKAVADKLAAEMKDAGVVVKKPSRKIRDYDEDDE